MAAAASDWAMSMYEPSPVARARITAARMPSAPNSGPAWIPMDACSGM